jgi:hypothetical protein
MVVSWTSATNCARFYNSALSGNRKPPPGWKLGFTLDSDHVWNGFMILSLLEDFSSRKQILSVHHSGLDQDRYKEAIRLRNHRMRLYSQPEIRHYCNKCTRFTTDGVFFKLSHCQLEYIEVYVVINYYREIQGFCCCHRWRYNRASVL